MSNVTLNQVLESLLAEDVDSASSALHAWFVDQSKTIHESLISESEGGFFIRGESLNGSLYYYGPYSSGDEAMEAAKYADCQWVVPASVLLPHELEFLKSDPYYGKPEMGHIDVAFQGNVELQKLAWELEGKTEEGDQFDEERWDSDQTYQNYLARDLNFGTYEVVMKHFPHFFMDEKKGIIDLDQEIGVGESEGSEGTSDQVKVVEEIKDISLGNDLDEFNDLEESFQGLKTVTVDSAEGTQVGDAGKITINKSSALPSKKGEDRVGGTPVEITGKNHKGFDRESAPKVKTAKVAINQRTSSEDDLKDVKKEGDKSALLNKKDGFGSDSPKSPIGGGAADLRGSDVKRK